MLWVGLTTLPGHWVLPHQKVGLPHQKVGLPHQHFIGQVRISPAKALLRLLRSNTSVLHFLTKKSSERLHKILWRPALNDFPDLIREANRHQLLQ